MNKVLAAAIAVGISGMISEPGFANEAVSSPQLATDARAANLLTPTAEVGEISQEPAYTEEAQSIDDELLIDDELPGDTEVREVEVYLRLSTEIFRYGDDNVEFQVPVRYRPSDDLSLEISPFMKYQPEDAEHDLDYGVRAAVEYRL